MNEAPLTNLIQEHISNRQNPSGVSSHQVDQINAAALDGAHTFDSFSEIGRQTGAFPSGPVDSSHLFKQLAERHGDPLTDLAACRHLAGTPDQPGFIHGAALGRVHCQACFKSFLLTDHGAMTSYLASTDCDACGKRAKDFHPANISNGTVTYLIHVCAACVPDHS
jgi:hypothetical protein